MAVEGGATRGVVEVAWGGYYTAKRDGSIAAFRLLDFNDEAYHAALYEVPGDQSPTLESLVSTQPKLQHVPIDAKGFVAAEELHLLGAQPLSPEDLEGYAVYLSNMGVTPEDITGLLNRIIEFSHSEPIRVSWTIDGDELHLSEAV